MMATAEEYAQWIVSNADKKGTPEFDTVAEAYQMAREQGTAKSSPMAAEPAPEQSAVGFVGGNLTRAIAGGAGQALDLGANIGNLVAATYGRLKGAVGGTPPDLPFAPPGTGQKMLEGWASKLGFITPSVEPQSKDQEYAASAIQAIPYALAGKPNLTQLPRAVTGAITSGIGAQAGRDLAPEGWEEVGSVMGSLAPGAKRIVPAMIDKGSLKPPSIGERATAERQAQRFQEAKESGFRIPPRMLKPDAPQQTIQDNFNKELKLPEGTELSPPTLQAYRSAHYDEGWKPVIAEPALNGQIVNDPAFGFRQKIADIASEERKLRSEFRNSVKDVGVQQMLLDFIKPAYTIDGTMAMIKRLRESSTRNLSSPNATDDSIRLGLVQRKVAVAFEDLVEKNVEAVGKPKLIDNFREARKRMAQAHTIEASLDPITGKIDPNKIAALQSETGTMTGQLKRLAQVTAAFPGAVKQPVRGEDLFTRKMSPYAVAHPAAVTAHLAARLLDPLTTSRPYQAVFVDPRAKLTPQQERLTRILIGSQQTDNARQE